MKKAFTLIEVLSVIIILGIIALLVTPSVISLIRNAESDLEEGKKTLVIEQTKPYVEEEGFEKIDGRMYCVTYNELLVNNYITNSFYEALTDVQKTQQIEVTVVNGNYEYEVVDTCDLSSQPLFLTLKSNTPITDWTNKSVNVLVETTASTYNYCIGNNNCTPDVSSNSGVVLLENDGDDQYVCASVTKESETLNKCLGPFNIDTILPSITGTGDISVDLNDVVDLTTNVVATDNLSGIKDNFTYTPTVVNTSSKDIQEVTYTVSDNAGNSYTTVRKILIDIDAPTVSFNPAGGNNWNSSNVSVTVSGNDNSGTGIKEIKWCSTTS